MKENKYTISEAARLLSVENHVLRYWEEELELNIPRNELGHRYYREEEIQLLHCIKELKNKGFQLKAVKEVLPDLEQKKLIDIHKLLTTQEELENQELEEAQKEAEQQRDSQTEREMQRGKERQNGKENEQQRNSKVYFSEENDRDTFENSSGNNKKGRTNNRNSDRNHNSTNSNGTVKEDRNCKVVTIHQNEKSSLAEHEEKMKQFEEIMGRIVGKALREQAENLGDAMGNHLCNKMLRVVDELMVEQEQREEERYKKLDEAIRSTQKARQEIAVSKDGIFKKKSRFFRKNKRKGILQTDENRKGILPHKRTVLFPCVKRSVLPDKTASLKNEPARLQSERRNAKVTKSVLLCGKILFLFSTNRKRRHRKHDVLL